MNNSLFGTPVSFSKTAALTKFYQIIIDLKATYNMTQVSDMCSPNMA